MLIDTNLDDHLSEINDELKDYDLIEFKNELKSFFMTSILPTKDELKCLSLAFRMCMDFIIENKDKITNGHRDTSTIIKYVNDNIDDVTIDIFRLVYNKESNRLGFNIIVSLNSTTRTYCLNEKININNIKYLTINELVDKMIILYIDTEKE